MSQTRSFALVAALYLVVLLATTGASLAMSAAVESTLAGWTASGLDHELAIDSLLVCLPGLLRESGQDLQFVQGRRALRHLALTVGTCHIECDMRPERGKLALASAGGTEAVHERLRDMALRNGLPEQNVRLWPTTAEAGQSGVEQYLWFDQIVAPTEFEEVFRWVAAEAEDAEHLNPSSQRGEGVLGSRVPPRSPAIASQKGGEPGSAVFDATGFGAETERRTWSDLVTFWPASGGDAWSLEVRTRVGNDVRRWYLVVSIRPSAVRVWFRGSIG